MKNKLSFILIAFTALMLMSAVVSNVLRTDGTMHGRGLSGDPIGVDTSATGKIATDYDIFQNGKNWWNANLIASGNRTHNALKKYSVVNNLNYWYTAAGVLDPMTFNQDSNAVSVNGPGQFSVYTQSGIVLKGGPGFNPRIEMHDSTFNIIETHGYVKIPFLKANSAPNYVTGYDDVTGQLYRTTFGASNYTPVASSTTNLDGTPTVTSAQYIRIGDVVTVSGSFTVDATANTTATSFYLTLPVSSSFANDYTAAGTAYCGTVAGNGASINSVSSNTRVVVSWISSGTSSQRFNYTYTYKII